MKTTFRRRKLRICFYEADKILLNRDKIKFDSLLKQLQSFEIFELPSLESENFQPCDLLVISAMHLAEEDFTDWIKKLHSNIEKQGNVWSPTVILAEMSFATIKKIIDWAIDINWYFDVIMPEHMSSFAIRITNLLRIHDHLHELDRYATELSFLQKRIQDIEIVLQDKLPETT